MGEEEGCLWFSIPWSWILESSGLFGPPLHFWLRPFYLHGFKCKYFYLNSPYFFLCCTAISIYWETNCLSSKACQLQKVLETADWKVQAKDPTVAMQSSWVFYICPKGLLLEGLPWWFSGKESTCQCRRHKRHRFDPWIGEIPWRRALPGVSHGQRSLAGYGP